MSLVPDRREFLIGAAALAASQAQAQNQAQTFIAGIVPGGPPPGMARPDTATPPPAARTGPRRILPETYWRICDECQSLGVHSIEMNTTNSGIVDVFEGSLTEFKEGMAKRGLTMVGIAMYSHMHDPAQRQELIEQHLRVARFLKAVGGKYINHLIAPAANLGNGDEQSYRKVDTKADAANASEVGKRVYQETGVRLGYHPEQGDLRASLVEPILEASDARYLDFLPDVGHFGATGVDPVPYYKKYRSRMVATHLKDFNPNAEFERNGQRVRGRMVPLGQGTVPLKELVQFLRDTKFTGCAMSESGGNQAMRDYMVQELGLKL